MTLTGILKNILLVVASVMIWNTTITELQFFGYAVALVGLVYYSLGWQQITNHSQAVTLWVRTTWNSPALDESRLSPIVRRVLTTTLVALIIVMLFIGLQYDAAASAGSTW
jgi:hypothetical protein